MLNIKNIIIGIICIIVSLWLAAALYVLKIEEGSDPEKLIISEGIERTYDELAEALARDIDFDLEMRQGTVIIIWLIGKKVISEGWTDF